MARLGPLVRLGLLLCLLPGVRGYSSGMVAPACSNMVPSHTGSPQTGPSPFYVTSSNTTYQDGDTITVQLQSTAATPFKGFLLQAREVGGETPLGSFTVVGGAAQTLSCGLKSPNSAVSHTSSSDKNLISATWTAAASENPKDIEFRATFVESYSRFWVSVRSPILIHSGASPNITPTAEVTTASVSSGSSTPSTLSISSAGCGRTKVCFSEPLNCDPAVDPGCHFMSASVSGLKAEAEAEAHFELKSRGPGYISFGFSQDQNMGNDDIYICGLDARGLVRVQHAYSTGRQKPKTLDLGNVSRVLGSLQDGVISCSFTSINPISTQEGQTGFDAPYYLLFAYGSSTDGEIGYHSGRFSSSEKLTISEYKQVGAAGSPQSIRAHGALMLIAWMTTASLGMMVARYLKGLAKSHSPFGKAVWFLAHVSLMSLTVILTLIAFIVIFSYVRGWSGGAHPVLGCLVTILAIIQPLGALFRCGPDHHMRYVFNWLHMLNALVMKVLAVAAIFTGLLMFDRSEDQALVKVMGGFVGWEAALYLSYELYSRCRQPGFDIDGPKAQTLPLSLLVVFFLGNLAFLVTLLVGISEG
ncbi:putative ferric-chelate reductase 1 isoform X1 [Gadus macrocephalus]|uniref:putative ferric-chelate reductase 1 isoform X1 n=1 Tax=Gadus macrocephalus TaxID=80720 RepID=UPI0028CB57B6|nr:putative ferric-chelate reductase 1 isoform X1 [Gadus macrocephalus]